MESERDAPIYRIPTAAGAAGNVKSSVDQYVKFHNEKETEGGSRTEGYAEMINQYYDLVTDFYEWGWGQSFHFANRYKGENFYSSIARSEHWLALQMGLKPGMKVLDVGCGIGGPAREIARFSGCNVTGINNNEYQITRANKHTKSSMLEEQVDFVKGNFMELPFPDNHFDAIYQIEATAHAPDKVACYSEIFRVLKPGGVFGSYEWCLTKNYDPENEEHRNIKRGIEEGDGLPDIATTEQVVEAMIAAGSNVTAQEDRCMKLSPCDIPWYEPIESRYSIKNLHHTAVGHKFVTTFLRTLERVKLLNDGTAGVQEFLHTAAVNLTLGGQKEIFTPAFFTLAVKEDKSSE
jgi:sterol 24-C-methyltransferase